MFRRLQVWGALPSMLIGSSFAQAQDAIDLALQIGLTPEVLAASGVSDTDTPLFLGALSAADSERAELAAAQESMDQSASRLTTLRSRLAQNPGDLTARTQLPQAKGAAATAKSRFDAAATALARKACADLPPQASAAINIHRSRSDAQCPSYFRASALTETELLRLERLLITERRANRMNRRLDPADEAFLQTVRARTDVVSAKVTQELYSDAIRFTFDQWAP